MTFNLQTEKVRKTWSVPKHSGHHCDTSRITRLDELSSVLRLERWTTEESSYNRRSTRCITRRILDVCPNICLSIILCKLLAVSRAWSSWIHLLGYSFSSRGWKLFLLLQVFRLFSGNTFICLPRGSIQTTWLPLTKPLRKTALFKNSSWNLTLITWSEKNYKMSVWMQQ